jgi:hypothetical protein
MRLQQSFEAADAVKQNPRYGRIDHTPAHPPGSSPVQITHDEPAMSIFLCSPMPGISVATDSLRQFYRKGIPQQRVIPPSPL